MSQRLRVLLVSTLAVGGLAVGMGSASAAEPAAVAQGAPVSDIFDLINDVTGPLVPQEIDDIIGGLFY